MSENLKKYISEARKILSVKKIRYAEIRFEEYTSSSIAIVGKEVEDAKTSENLGVCCRILSERGWGFVSFNNLNNLSDYFFQTVEQSKLIKSEKIEICRLPQTKADCRIIPSDSPFDYSLSTKFNICRKYNDLLQKNKKLQSSSVRYRDLLKKTFFLNTEGTELFSETVFCGIAMSAIAREGRNIQTGFTSTGDYNGFKENILNRESECSKISERAIRLLNAKPVKPGKYTVILDPVLCGVFTHEAFGHLSEADFIYENESLRKIMELGRRFGSTELNIIDDPTLKNMAGSYDYDSEGAPGRKTYLIKNGILTGRLHSRETAKKMNEELTGHSRAINYSFQPIVRMSNTYMDKGSRTPEEIIASTEYGIYAKGALGGMTNTEMFTFSSEEAFEIKNGKIAAPLRDVILTGNVFETLKNIDMFGNDLKLHGGLGGCGKAGQSPLPVSDGGPHIRIKDVIIGGK